MAENTENEENSFSFDIIRDTIKDILKVDNETGESSKEDTSKEIIVGIDLGTTNSCVSIWRNNNLEIIPDEFGNSTIPSYVAFSKSTRYVGLEAKKQKDINPKNVFYEVKRLIGRKFSEDSVEKDKEFFNYDLITDSSDNILLQIEYGLYSPEEISSMLLNKMKQMASDYLKQEITKAVITVPAYFNDAQRQATKDAAEIAGLNCVRIINEPTAAALAYGLLRKSEKKDDDAELNIIVYDLGGGTLDCSLMTITNGLFEVRASVGNTHLGGSDFDKKIISYCVSYFKKKNKIEKLGEISTLSFQRLRTACENAKKIVSVSMKTTIAVRDFYEGIDLLVPFTREKFEQICKDLFILCLKPLEDIMESCDIEKRDIDEIILVGGMTRVPLIRDNIRKYFNGKEPNCSMNPDDVVSAGAAVQGYILSSKGEHDPFSENVTLLDIIPLSLGVETMGGIMTPLIKRNTVIPVSRKKKFSTDTDDCESVTIRVFEGERKMTKHNFLVGEFELGDIEPAPRGKPQIEVKFNVDVNGIITVTAEDLEKSNKKSITITGNKGRLTNEQIKKLVEESKEHELRDKLEKQKKRMFYEIDDMCSNIKMNLKNDEFKLQEKDKAKIKEEIEKIEHWLTEKKYHEREENDFKNVLERIREKFGTLILRFNNNGNFKSAGNSESNQAQSTTVYGNEDDEDEETQKIFEKIEETEMGIEELEEDEKKEIKELKNTIIEQCHSLYEFVKNINFDKIGDKISDKISDKIGDKEGDKERDIEKDAKFLIEYIDDALLWIYIHVKPKLIDYKTKLEEISRQSNEFFGKYPEITEEVAIDKIEELENMCFTIKTTMSSNMITFDEKESERINISIDTYLEEIVKYRLNVENVGETEKEEFERKCVEYLKELDDMCGDLKNKLLGVQTNTQTNTGLANSGTVDNDEGTDLADILKQFQESVKEDSEK